MIKSGDLTPSDRLLLCITAALLSGLSWLWAPSFIPPDIWEDVAVAACLRPPEAAFPLLWHALVSPLFKWFGMARTLQILQIAGSVSLGILALMAGSLFNRLLPGLLRFDMRQFSWSRRVVRFVLLQAVVFFCCADPVWRACRYFSPTTLHLLLTLPAVGLLLRFLQTGFIPYVYWSASVMGLLAANTPVGIALGLAAGVLSYWKALLSEDMTTNPLANPLVRVVVQRRMTGFFFIGLLVGATANTSYFLAHDGLAALDWSGLMYIVHYLHRYVQITADMATPLGWLFITLVGFVPLIVSLYLLKKSTDEDQFLPYWCGLAFIAIGLLSFSQVAGFRTFWFWTWIKSAEVVKSGYLLSFCSFLCALSAAYALCVLGVEVYFRNNRRIADQRFQDAAEEPLGAATLQSFKRIERLTRSALVLEPLVVLLCIIPFRYQPLERRMLDIVGEAVQLTARECRGVERLFTDGALDPAVEISAATDGHPLKALSMLGGGTPREIWLRTRDAADEEDRTVLATGVADALRTWVRDKTNRVHAIAVQLGFELWKREKIPMPIGGGLVARPASATAFDPAAGRQTATNLAERILACYKNDKPATIDDRRLRDAFTFVQWRLSTLCRVRADALDQKGQTLDALAESELADALDDQNETFSRIRNRMDWAAQQRGGRLSPREGLKVGLDHANFSMARVFAQQVLQSDPDDSPANFAMGMNYFVQEQYGRAEVYLKRCLVRRPNEPAVLNNLAVAQMRQGRLDEAETNATRALKSLPTSTDILRTLKSIQDRKRKQTEAARQKLP